MPNCRPTCLLAYKPTCRSTYPLLTDLLTYLFAYLHILTYSYIFLHIPTTILHPVAIFNPSRGRERSTRLINGGNAQRLATLATPGNAQRASSTRLNADASYPIPFRSRSSCFCEIGARQVQDQPQQRWSLFPPHVGPCPAVRPPP